MRSVAVPFVLALALAAAARADDAPPAAPETSGVCAATRLDLATVADADLRRDLAAFDGPSGAAETFAWTARELRSGPSSRVLEVKFPTPLPSPVPENNTVWCRYYPPVAPPGKRVPAALVLHHLGGDFGVEATIAEFLARSGIAAMEVEYPYYGPRRPKDRRDVPKGLIQADADGAIASMRQAVADIRRAADWLAARPEVDPARLGCVGVSLGGILGSLAAGVDPRLRLNTLVIAGADLPTILFHESDETERARAILKEKGVTQEALAAALRPIEPLRFAGRIYTPGLLMLNAKRDEIVPREATDALWQAAGHPAIVWYECGHKTIAAFLRDLCARTRDHMLDAAQAAGAEPGAAATPKRQAF
jgi:dienelactone hydrolase